MGAVILDPKPKTRREELYGRRSELREVRDVIIKEKMGISIVGGPRRIGKTSVTLVAINELRDDKGFSILYFDAKRITRRGQLGVEMAKRLGVEPSEDPVEVLKRARSLGRYIFIILDEPQEAPRKVHRDFMYLAEAIAFKIRYASLLLVSSAPGVAKDAIGLERVGTPLYRYSRDYEAWIGPLKRDEAEAMLTDGLRERGLSPDPDMVREAVEFFGGIPGWLVFFGLGLLAGMEPEQIYREAIQIALEEIRKLAPRPQLVLKVLAEGHRSWSEAIRALEDLEERIVSRNGFAKALHYLEKRALVKNYQILDPVYERAAKILDPKEPLMKLGLVPEQEITKSMEIRRRR